MPTHIMPTHAMTDRPTPSSVDLPTPHHVIATLTKPGRIRPAPHLMLAWYIRGVMLIVSLHSVLPSAPRPIVLHVTVM